MSYNLDELTTLLRRSPATIKQAMKRNLMAVLPRRHIPGARLLRWCAADVEAWPASFPEHSAVGARGPDMAARHLEKNVRSPG